MYNLAARYSMGQINLNVWLTYMLLDLLFILKCRLVRCKKLFYPRQVYRILYGLAATWTNSHVLG